MGARPRAAFEEARRLIQFYMPEGGPFRAIGVGPSPNPHAPWSHERGTVGKLMRLCGREIPFYNLYEEEPETWSRDDAQRVADFWLLYEEDEEHSHPLTVLMLGRKVCDAFGVSRPEWLREYELTMATRGLAVPHPSGLNRWYNDPKNARRAENALRLATRP